jgi:hypothetical protein
MRDRREGGIGGVSEGKEWKVREVGGEKCCNGEPLMNGT